MRLDSKQFLQTYDKSPFLQSILKRYIFVRIYQLFHTIGCNRFYVVNNRLARWILMSQDCAHFNKFPITHEFLSYILRMRRAGITKSAGILQKRKLISYRKGLEAASCECYNRINILKNSWIDNSILNKLNIKVITEILILKILDIVKYYVANKFE